MAKAGFEVEFIAGKNAAISEADLLINGTIKADVKFMGLHKNTAGELAKGARQVGEGGTVYWVRPKISQATKEEMEDFLKTFVPKNKDGKVIKNVTYKVIEESSLPKAFGK